MMTWNDYASDYDDYGEDEKKSAMKDPTAQKMMKTPEQVSGMMNAVASGDIGVFQKKLSQEFAAAKAQNAPTVPVSMQPGRINEGPQGPKGPVA